MEPTTDTRRLLRPLPLLALLLGVACASARVESRQDFTGGAQLRQPPVLMVYDFAVSANEAVQDTFGSEFYAEPPSKELDEAHAVAASLSTQLVEKLQKMGIDAIRATDKSLPLLDAIVLRGEFISIDKGSAIKRLVIGFGAGASEMRVRVHAYQATRYGLRRLVLAEVKATGSKSPGMAVPVGAGAAMGRAAASVAVSGGMNFMREARGGLHADAGNLAGEIAKRAEAFYKRQGWL